MFDGNIREALTFDDVLVLPARSSVLPKDCDLSTRLTRNIRLNCPLLSSPMDTVTEAEMAIALALEGGLGVIHRNCTIKKQVEEVNKVKRAVTGMIVSPITMRPDQKIHEAMEVMREQNISGIPITSDEKLVGILTNRDLRFETNLDLPISKLMTKENLITIPLGTSLDKSKELLHEKRIEKLLVVDDNGMLKGLITIKDIEKSIRYPNAVKDHLGQLMVGAAVGVTESDKERFQELVHLGTDMIVVDTAHGHSDAVLNAIRAYRKQSDSVQLVGGNVATTEGARNLIEAGVDAVKVGIGPGSICTTRIVAGVGVPQITAISDCVKEGEKHNIPIISDGGIKYSGDIVKALVAGGESVMIGSIFAGTEESPGEKVLYQGRSYKEYRGMGSLGAMSEGSGDRYQQDLRVGATKLVPEGVEGRIPYKGSLSFTAHQLLGGLRSGMGYSGCRTIDDLRKKAKFIKITHAGLRESHVHDVTVTREAPNYRNS